MLLKHFSEGVLNEVFFFSSMWFYADFQCNEPRCISNN